MPRSNRDDRNRGVAVVDIGMHSTDLVVYDGEAVLLARSLADFGGSFHARRGGGADRAIRRRRAAEDGIRLRDAGAHLRQQLYRGAVATKAGCRAKRPRKQLNEILEARAEELFIHVGSELVTIGMDQKLLEGVILAGGGAMLNGMCDMAERVLNCPARNAIPEGIQDFPDDLCNPAVGHRGGTGAILGAVEDQSGDQAQSSRS